MQLIFGFSGIFFIQFRITYGGFKKRIKLEVEYKKFWKTISFKKFGLKKKYLVKYRKVAYLGHIGNMVRNDFDHKKKYQDLFFIKGNLG